MEYEVQELKEINKKKPTGKGSSHGTSPVISSPASVFCFHSLCLTEKLAAVSWPRFKPCSAIINTNESPPVIRKGQLQSSQRGSQLNFFLLSLFSPGLWLKIKSLALKPLCLFSQSMVAFSFYCFILLQLDTRTPASYGTGGSGC